MMKMDGREAPHRGPGKGKVDGCVTFEPSEWQLQGWAVGLHSELINTSGQFSNASGLIKPQEQFAKCFLLHLNCLDCVEFE